MCTPDVTSLTSAHLYVMKKSDASAICIVALLFHAPLYTQGTSAGTSGVHRIRFFKLSSGPANSF